MFANLGDNHGFISKEYTSIGMKHFGETKSKAMRAWIGNMENIILL